MVSGNRGRGGVDDRDNSLGDGVNKAVLVEVLGESLEGEGFVAHGSGDQVPDSGGEGANSVTMVDVRGGGDIDQLQLGVSKAGAQDSKKRDLWRKIIIIMDGIWLRVVYRILTTYKLLHDDKVKLQQTSVA